MARKDLIKMLTDNYPDIVNKELWIFGTGQTATFYYNGLLRLEQEGFIIEGYIDDNREKWGTKFNNKEIVSLKSLKHKMKNICVLICTVQGKVARIISKKLRDEGFEHYYIDEVIFKLHKNDVLRAYDLLTDEESKSIYEILLKERMDYKGVPLPVDTHKQYFALRPFMLFNINDVFVDCGAYVGDTIEKYIWERSGAFKKIIGFEPDTDSFNSMKHRINRLKLEWGLKDGSLELYNKGVSDKTLGGYVKRDETNNGLASKIVPDNNNNNSLVVSIDEFIKEDYTFLKADIESWEYKMLQGAAQGIKTNKPLLAVCIYHSAIDFYEIPLLIHNLVPEYNLAVRHHSNTLDETVLYAWIS